MILLDPLARPVVAHRGASGAYPENTLLAFGQACDQGADAVELDVRISADGVPVVIHDPTVDRTTDGRGAVCDMPLARLREFDAGAGERIPTFAEVLEAFPATPLIVEIKVAAAAEAALRVLQDAGAAGRALVGSFDHRALDPFRAAGVPTSASRRETAAFWIASGLGRRPGAAGHRGFTVPEWWRGLHVVTRRFVRTARRREHPVHVWTVDDPDRAIRLWTIGVSGIITNFPERMLALPS